MEEQIKKAMLSQPMAGKTEEQIVETRERAIEALKPKGYEIVNTLFTDEWYSRAKMAERGVVQIPLCFMAKGMENMSKCHAVYFCKGWTKARGCRIEHAAALAYGLEIIYEDENEKPRDVPPTISSEEFISQCKRMVFDYTIEHIDKSDELVKLAISDVFVVWYCKALQNHKALLSTPLHDGMYYEITYNGDMKKYYFDAYKKFEHKDIKP